MKRLSTLAALALATVPYVPAAQAQEMRAAPAGHEAGVHHGSMSGMSMPMPDGDAQDHDMQHPDMQHPESPTGDHAGTHAPAHGAMPMGHHANATLHQASPSSAQAMQPHDMGPMQGGRPPPGARDPDYSDGIDPAPMHDIGMAMDDDPAFTTLRVDHLEAFSDRHDNGQQWEIGTGYGNNRDRLWLHSEGERSNAGATQADVEVFWQHAVAAFWDARLGLRTDVGDGPDRQWLAFGIQGLAPYWFELEATGYLGTAGRTAVRLRADYELPFTQRLVLQPEVELNARGRADPARGLGSGLSEASFGLRLRYEIRREVAPYVGLVWTRRFGGTASFARMRGEGRAERRWVAGIRLWF